MYINADVTLYKLAIHLYKADFSMLMALLSLINSCYTVRHQLYNAETGYSCAVHCLSQSLMVMKMAPAVGCRLRLFRGLHSCHLALCKTTYKALEGPYKALIRPLKGLIRPL